ncbi:hypothetical protein FB567DRAFT_631456 [Paraphoma chrysanthemicola]|uniref:Uncharacterized protein n=1 Tax=Paraphoma chrysanthemicola TaxID=798071 RepID=A0A8K0R1U7_9PLEO|nr:hypothetical protein FB567DRAFT_631456 [Paraphoma chrysanthemicola]
MAALKRKPSETVITHLRPQKSRKLTDARPFSSILNRDVREVIYSFMSLPPFASSGECCGLLLSCREAHDEIAEAAAHRLRAHLVYIEAKLAAEHGKHFDHPTIIVPNGLASLRQLVIELHVAMLEPTAVRWTLALKNLYLDKFTVMIRGTSDEARASLELKKFPALLPAFLPQARDLDKPGLYYIAATLGEVLNDIARFAYFNARCRPWSEETHAVLARTIIVAWDFTMYSNIACEPTEGRLKGRTHEFPRFEKDLMTLRNELPADHVFAHGYELMNRDALRGECGLCSPSR